jgi:hypothetical protein
VFDVIEDHRLTVGCDAARKTTADWDANAPFDFLLEAYRCLGDELVRLLVEQQDSARVDTEDLAGAEKERRQESVELQMRECRVRERLELLQTIGVLDAIPHCLIVSAQADLCRPERFL